MAEFKVNIGNPKSGKTHKKDIVGDEAKELLGKKIGDTIKGDKIGFSGYEFEITGGSDSSGFPMRKDVSGINRKRILIVDGVGTRHNRAGMRLRRTVAGNQVNPKTAQINLKVLKVGKSPLGEVPAEAAPAEGEAKPAETKAAPEEKKEAPKKEAKPEEAKSEEQSKK